MSLVGHISKICICMLLNHKGRLSSNNFRMLCRAVKQGCLAAADVMRLLVFDLEMRNLRMTFAEIDLD